MTKVGSVVFDADDTLWQTQHLYDSAIHEFVELLVGFGFARASIRDTFSEVEITNVTRLGFSRQRFPSSMKQTYEQLCSEASVASTKDRVDAVVAIGEAVFAATPTVADDASTSLSVLREKHRIILFTSGDAAVQEHRIEQSGLRASFDSIHITPRKTIESWRELAKAESLNAWTDWSVGNSITSDISPALELGLRAVLLVGGSWEDSWSGRSLSEAPGVVRAKTLSEATGVIVSSYGRERIVP